MTTEFLIIREADEQRIILGQLKSSGIGMRRLRALSDLEFGNPRLAKAGARRLRTMRPKNLATELRLQSRTSMLMYQYHRYRWHIEDVDEADDLIKFIEIYRELRQAGARLPAADVEAMEAFLRDEGPRFDRELAEAEEQNEDGLW